MHEQPLGNHPKKQTRKHGNQLKYEKHIKTGHPWKTTRIDTHSSFHDFHLMSCIMYQCPWRLDASIWLQEI